MALKIFLAGIGGQGVIYATKVIAQAALLRGEQVLASENHGMSQRGGSVVSHVKIGGGQAPLIRRGTADVLVGFDRSEAIRNLPFVRPAGSVFVNSAAGLEAALANRLAELEVGVYAMDATATAQALGAPGAANLMLLGFVAAHAGLGLDLETLKMSVQTLGPERAVALNWKVLEAGAAHYAAV